MAYFRCGQGAGGNELKILITTTDTSLYGQTITISKDGSTVGTTTFDNTGNAEYTVDEAGLYTVSCGGASESVLVEDEYEVSLSAIPDGKTVLPVNDIQTWLQCAGIFDKNYTTLDEVLADTTTLLELINSNNAVDYMVRSHAWCENPGLVPTMTSNTTPSGVASASTYFNDPANYPYRAFSGDSYSWVASSTSVGQWLQYEFPTATLVGFGKIILRATNSRKGNDYHFIVKASNDGFTTESIVSERITIPASSENTRPELSFKINTNDIAYKQYRIVFEESIYTDASNFAGVTNLQYYTYAYSVAIPDDATAMTYIGANNYAADTLLADDGTGNWLESICNSAYFESVLNVKIPTLTSNSQCIASSYYSGSTYETYKMFDENISTIGTSNQNYSNPSSLYFGYDFTRNVKIYKVKYVNSQYTGSATFKLQGSADNSTYDDVGGNISITAASQTKDTSISNPTSYRYWRIKYSEITSSGGSYAPNLCELQFYGREE